MSTSDLVTGAFGFTGSRIAERLLADGRRVMTLTRRVGRNHPLARRVERLAYDFDSGALSSALRGVDTVYITYWMRFPRGDSTWPRVVANVERLAQASSEAGVRRLVYISVSNAAHDATTAYFRAKAAAEEAVRAVSARGGAMTCAIIRPTLLFGESDILINNMAWTLRRLPVFGVPGDGRYLVQPVYVGDVADLAVSLGHADDFAETDACGRDILEFADLVRLVRAAVRSRALVVNLPPPVVLATTRLLGVVVRDVVLTGDEIRELMEGVLVSQDDPTCPTRFPDWLERNAASVGRRWESELARNFRLAGFR